MKYFFPKSLLIFTLCIFYANCFSVSENEPVKNTLLLRTLRNTDENIEYDYHYPCQREGVEMGKPSGELTPETNYWNGRVDLTEYSYLKSIKLVIRVDQLAKIVVDPAMGTIAGAKTGKVFRISYKGTPIEVPEVKFKIIGTQGTFFPNLITIHLNNRDICKGALTVSTSLFE